MKNSYARVFIISVVPLVALMAYYSFFYKTNYSDEQSHIIQLIERLPEIIELNKQNGGSVHIDFPNNAGDNFVNANILTFNLSGSPAKIAYRIQYDRKSDSIVVIKKE